MTLAEYFTTNARLQREWAFDKNTLSPDELTPHARAKVWWRCERGHEWQANTYAVTAGSTCPYCAGKKPIVGETDLATTHPYIINMWSAKNDLAPTDLTAGSQRKAWFVCDRGHEWYAQTFSVVHGSGCPYCTGKRAIPGETDLATVRPEILAEWDFEKNTDLDPITILPSSHKEAWWKCERGHSWKAAVFSRTREKNATGCPYCSGRQVLPGYNDLATLKPLLVKEWHPTLNGNLTPEHVSPGSNKKAWWKCPDGHVWQASIYARAKPNGTGCPVCAGKVKLRSDAAKPRKLRQRAQPRKAAEKAAAVVHI